MGLLSAADPALVSDVPPRVGPAVRRQRRRSAPRLQLRGFPELPLRRADPHGCVPGRPLRPRAARSAAEAPQSSTPGGGAAVRSVRGGSVHRDVRGLAEVEETPARRRAVGLHFNHHGFHR